LAAILLNGLNGDLVVNGKSYNSQMPAWNTRDDEELAAVMTYIRSSWGNKADPVSRELVAAIRKEVEGKGEWNAASLAAFTASPSSGSSAAASTPAAGASPSK
jgi:hypothetical protein